MTYVAQLYKVFSSLDRVETAGRRVGKFVNFEKSLNELIEEYERRTRALNQAVENKASALSTDPLGNDYSSAKSAINSFRDYKKTQRRQWISEQAELVTLFGNIQAKQKSQNRPPYSPPQGLHPKDVNSNFEHLSTSEKARRTNLNNNLRAILDGLRKEFANPANAFYTSLTALKSFLGTTDSSSLEQQLSTLQGKLAELDSLHTQLPAIHAAEQKCDAANIEDNEYTDLSYDDLDFEFSQIHKNYLKKISFIESQIQAANESRGVSPEQLQEFKETFNHFDSQKSGKLSKLDFKSCLSGLGVVELDFEGNNAIFNSLFSRVSGGADTISFDQFVDYMISITADSVSPQQLLDSFETIAGSKGYLTVNDLKIAQLSEDQINYLTSTLPPFAGIAGGYDYKAWLKTQV